jgi:hypothetical protein
MLKGADLNCNRDLFARFMSLNLVFRRTFKFSSINFETTSSSPEPGGRQTYTPSAGDRAAIIVRPSALTAARQDS